MRHPLLMEDPFWDGHRILSAVVAVLYLLIASVGGGAEAFVRTLGFLIMPIVCIWFADELSELTGFLFLHEWPVTEPSNARAVRLVAWIALLSPVIGVAISGVISAVFI